MNLTDTAFVLTTAIEHTGPWREGYGGPPGPLFALFWLFVLGTVVFLVVWQSRVRTRANPRLSGERLLAERFASGEIDESEYEQRLEALRRRGRK